MGRLLMLMLWFAWMVVEKIVNSLTEGAHHTQLTTTEDARAQSATRAGSAVVVIEETSSPIVECHFYTIYRLLRWWCK